MDATLVSVIALIGVALTFDYINGFHDAANSIATVVSTRVLTPGQAVLWAAVFNFLAAFTFGTAVATTIGKGMIDINIVTSTVIFGGLLAAIAKAGWGSLIPSGWTKTLVFIVMSPIIGMGLALIISVVTLWIFRGFRPARVDKWFRRLQLVSAAAYSLGHGTNDAQKTMGIIAGLLFAAGYLPVFAIPLWVILAAHAAIALGTLTGGWRIVHTMGSKITQLQPFGGF